MISTEIIQETLRALLEQTRKSGKNGLLSFYRDVEEKLRINYPTSIFRYRKCCEKYHIDALKEKQLWLSHPSAFNDPYDTLVYFDIADNVRKIKEQKGTVAEKIARLFCEMDSDSESQGLYGKMVAKVNSFSEEHRHLLEQKFNNEILGFESKYIHFSNDFNRILRQDSHLRVACFSGTITSPPMWAYYADNGKGFAIEYKTDYLRSICHKYTNNGICISNACNDFSNDCPDRYAAHLFPVLYSDSRYDFSSMAWKIFLTIVLSTTSNDEKKQLSSKQLDKYPTFYHKLSLIKSMVWRHENEWRLIAQCAEAEPHLSYLCSPVAVYLGSDISAKDEQELLNIIAGLNNICPDQKILTYKMKVNFQNKRNELEFLRL